MCADSREQPTRIGQYEIQGLSSEDASGKVYRAARPTPGRGIVLVKVLPESFAADAARVERFRREAQAVASLTHPNVARLLEADRDGDRCFFATESVGGTDLGAVLGRRRLSLREAFAVFKAICRGLEAAHRQGITHRELTPANILVSEDLEVVKLAGFGLGRRESTGGEMETMNTAAVSMASLYYMAPEQAGDPAAADPRSDIYSAGAVFYEMLTGRVPVGRFGLPSQGNSEVPPEVDALVLKCLASHPAERHATVGALLQAVTRLEDQLRLGLVNELRGISTSTSRILRGSSGRRPMKLVVPLVIVALAAVAALLWWLAGRSDGEAPPAAAETAVEATPEPATEAAAATEAAPAPAAEPASEPPTPPPAPPTRAPARAAATPPAVEAAPAPAPAAPAGPSLEDLQVARDKIAARLYEPAIADLRAFLAADPAASAALDAYFLLGEAYEGLAQPQQAMAVYVEIQSRFGAVERAAEARFRLASVAGRTKGREREAIATLGQLAQDFPASDWAPKALAAAARIESAQKLTARDAVLGMEVPAALVTWRRLSETYPQSPASEEALWNLGQMLEDLKRYQPAAQAFADLGERFPGTPHDAWWRAAQLYDRRLDDAPRAIQAYERVPRASASYDAAQKRLRKLRD